MNRPPSPPRIMSALLTVTLLSGCATAEDPPLLLNEFMPSNLTIIQDESKNFSDWIELYNPGEADVDLGGWFLSDDLDDPVKAPLPDGIRVPAGGFLLLWADGGDGKGPLHLPFSLKSAGEELALSQTRGDEIVLADTIEFEFVADDWSIARLRDGQAPWRSTNSPTPAASNGGE